jgi:SAM-dependent methyltransferase
MGSDKPSTIKQPRGMNHLINLLDALQEYHVISAGIELGLFELLEQKALSAAEIADGLGFERALTQAWCEAAASCGFLVDDHDKFSLTNWSKSFLLSKAPTYFGSLHLYTKLIPDAFSNLRARFSGKRPLMETRHAIETVESIAPFAQLTVPLLIQNLPVLKGNCQVLDLGTGLGSYLIKLALLNPQLKGIGIDGGWVAEIVYEARRRIERNKLQDRVKIILADVMDVKLSEKFDVILMSGFLQAFNPENALKILQKAHFWLKPTGKLVLQEMLLEEGRLRPKSNVLLNLLLHLETPQAGLFEYNQLEELLKSAQFSEVKRIDLVPQISHIIAGK